MADDTLSRMDRVCRLLDIYGGLLTERQRQFCEQHFAEDLSFGEIAREQNISRQAVHDTVKNALALLDHYEAQLHLLASEEGGADGPAASDEAPTAGRPDSTNAGRVTAKQLATAREALEEIRLDIKRRGGVIYDGHAIARQLEDIEELLEPKQ